MKAYPWQEPVGDKYRNDPEFRILADTMMSLLWNGKYTYTELRQACILAACQVEAVRIGPLLFDPNNCGLEQGVLAARPGLESE